MYKLCKKDKDNKMTRMSLKWHTILYNFTWNSKIILKYYKFEYNIFKEFKKKCRFVLAFFKYRFGTKIPGVAIFSQFLNKEYLITIIGILKTAQTTK